MAFIVNTDPLPHNLEGRILKGPVSISHRLNFTYETGVDSWNGDGRDAITDRVLRNIQTVCLTRGYEYLKGLAQGQEYNALFNVHLVGNPRVLNTERIYTSQTSKQPVRANVEVVVEGLAYKLREE